MWKRADSTVCLKRQQVEVEKNPESSPVGMPLRIAFQSLVDGIPMAYTYYIILSVSNCAFNWTVTSQATCY